MALTPSPEHSLRGRIAAEHARRDPDPDLISSLRREHALVRIGDSVRRILSGVPPLTVEDRRRVVETVEAIVDGAADAAA